MLFGTNLPELIERTGLLEEEGKGRAQSSSLRLNLSEEL
jgi:hypothetical protein